MQSHNVSALYYVMMSSVIGASVSWNNTIVPRRIVLSVHVVGDNANVSRISTWPILLLAITPISLFQSSNTKQEWKTWTFEPCDIAIQVQIRTNSQEWLATLNEDNLMMSPDIARMSSSRHKYTSHIPYRFGLAELLLMAKSCTWTNTKEFLGC